MKIKIGILAAVLLVGISLPAWAVIDVNVGDSVTLVRTSYGATQGPFKMTDLTKGNDFQTFCAEVNEHFNPGSTYIVDSLSDRNFSPTDFSFLTPYAAWVYTMYRTDSVFRGKVISPANYDSVQDAIWAGMVPGSSNAMPGIKFSEYWKRHNHTMDMYTDPGLDALDITYDDFTNSGWNQGLGNVRVANLEDKNGGRSQDQLVLIPEPMSVIVWSLLGLCVSGGLYLRKHRV
jgi:hypothetical protein